MTSPRLLPLLLLFSGLLIGQPAPTIGGCPSFPADNIWNTAVDTLPLHPHSADYIASVGAGAGIRYDATMPINIVPGNQPKVQINLAYPPESDAGPYPIPPNVQVEPGDLHIILVDKDNCILYETYNSVLQPNGSWNVDSAAKWNLRSDALRPAGWTSADGAGLPIMPGILRYAEVASGQIDHALRITVPDTQANVYQWPARHYASHDTSVTVPMMGQRFRLQAGFDISGFSPDMQVVLRAIKKYGVMVSDNGLPWSLQADTDPRWSVTELQSLRNVLGSNLEAVDVSGLMIDPNSGQAAQPGIGAALSSMAVSPNPVVGGKNVTVTVKLTGAAPASGAEVALTGSNAVFPTTSVLVGAGLSTETYSVSTAAPASSVPVTVTASYNGISVSAPAVTVTPPLTNNCPAFPANNIWNTAVNNLPVHPNSAAYINSIGAAAGIRYDTTMPINLVPGTQPKVPINIANPAESDPGPYPIPPDAQVEPGDLHVIVIDRDNCLLYETYNSVLQPDGSWNVDSAAKWALTSNALRPAGWTSADAAGLPIMPGILQYAEMASGQINHALRFTAPNTQALYVWPARHLASSSTDPTLPPMGQRFRLKAGFDMSGYSADMQVVLRAIQQYGIMLADNGLAWSLQADPDPRWNIDELLTLRQVLGSNLEAVDVSGLIVDPNSGQVATTAAVLTIASTHTGSFVQGQSGATYTLALKNSGSASTSGTVTVTDTLPAGLTATSIAGTGWSCTEAAGPCSRGDILAAGASYPAITLTVNVAGNAPASVTNTASVSGGGSATGLANDPTGITPATAPPVTIAPTVTANASIWAASAVPAVVWNNDPSPVTLGVRFRSDTAGAITGIRFYKGAGNNGNHIGLLYSANGSLLAQAAFTGETAYGWQQANFSAPVSILANTVYIAAWYTTSGYPYNSFYFTSTGVDNPPLHALKSAAGAWNGVFAYGGAPRFPAASNADTNYWADVVFSTLAPDLTISKTHSGNFLQGQTGAAYTLTVVNSGTGPTSGTVTVADALPAGLTAVSMLGTGWSCTQPAGPCTRADILAADASYAPITVTVSVAGNAPSSVTNTATVSGGGETNTANDSASDPTTIGPAASTSLATSVWPASAVPGTAWNNDPSPVTVGVKFRSDVAGSITGIRFYKGAGNNGTHIGLLYSSAGTLLAKANFTGETASGWQQANFASPVAISANTTYIAAFFTTSGYARDAFAFTSAGVDKPPLHALRSGVDGYNGVYAYGGAPQFPTASNADSNYWADVAFSTTPAVSSIWPVSAAPSNAWNNDASPVTVGVKFRSDAAGVIPGIRFYKGAGNNGTHIGLLYSGGGTLLAQATFTGETASGWQQVNFSAPVAIAANTTYIAALFTTSGYARDSYFFTNAGVDSPPLHALKSGVDGYNGVYAYGSAPQFPAASNADTNYWVDVAFAAGGPH